MSQYTDGNTKTFTAGAAIAQYARVKFSSGNVITAGIADKDIGIATTAAAASGDPVAIALISKSGTHKAIAAAAIAQGAAVYTAADGEVSVSASTAFQRGIALEAAATDQDIIEIMPTIGDTAVA